MTDYCDCASCRAEMMEVDGVEYRLEEGFGCTVRPMFQLINPLYLAEADAASWPEPTATNDLDSVFW